MNYLVTEAVGFIGSNLVKRLLDLGRNVIVLVNQPSWKA
jgi:nucleoside-diphosphate-sugar epimerase